MRLTLLKLPLFIVALLSLTFNAQAVDANKKEIVFGTTVGDFGNMVRDSIKPMLEKQGYKVKLIEFTDYVRPNLATAEGSIDVNIFQHKPYLDSFSQMHKLQLSPVTQVPTGPLGLYSGRLSALDQIKSGTTIALPNDPSNQARALILLDELGWIKLPDNIDHLQASLQDIVENSKNIKLIALDAAQLPRVRADVDFAIVNGNYAISSGIKFTEALYLEPGYTFVNWVVVRSADADKPYVQDVIAAYNSAEFKDYAHKTFVGYKFPQSWQQ